MKEKFMLVVDDLEVNRQMLAECFQEEYAIEYACDGEEAIAKIKEYAGRITVILLDIVMPNVDGIEVLKWMQNKPCQTIPVIAVTAEADYQLSAIEHGAWDFIAKPTNNAVIKARVNNVLARYSQLAQQKTSAMLKKAQIEIDNLANSIPGGIAVYRLTDHFETLYFSDGVAALSGYTREEYEICMEQPAENIVYEADRKRLFAFAVRELKSGRDVDTTFRIRHKSGELVWLHMNAAVMSEKAGALVIHAVLQSVSKRDQLNALLLSETQSAIYVSELESYELLYLNETAAKILHTEGEAYGGQRCYAYIFGRSSPCPFCRTREMSRNCFSERVFVHPSSHRVYQLRGKLLDWCGISAHVEYILDITEQYITQQKLSDVQAMLTTALQNADVAVWEYDPASRSIPQSVNMRNIDGVVSSIENVPESLIANGFVHPQSVEDFRELYREVLRGKGKVQKDLCLHTANDGGYRWERTIYVPVLDEQGRLLKSIGTSMDISEQKDIEKSFQETEKLRAKITNGVMLNISRDSVDTVYSGMDEIQEFEEKSMTEFFRKTGLRMREQNQREQYYDIFDRERLLRAYSVGKTEQMVEALCRIKDDEYRIMQFHIRLTKSPQTGDVLGYAYVIDVDDQRTAEAVMDKVALDHFEFILLLNLESNTAKMVSNLSESTQTAPKDYPDYTQGIEKFCERFVVREQQESCREQMSIENLKKQLALKSKYTILLAARPNDELRQYRLCFTYLNRYAGKVLVTAEDITELVREEQEKSTRLSEALEAAKKASSAQNQFLSNMSHDMRTPMNAVIGFSQMALDDAPSAETMLDSMRKINESGRYLLSLINDILDMAKMESNKTRLHLEPVDAKTLFGGIVASVQPMMEAKHIRFAFESHGFIEGKAAMIDRLRMQQIFINLLSNAVKFTPDGGKVECITDTLGFDGVYVRDRITIRDNGVGMSEEFLEKAFLPFEQEETIGEEIQSGTGLGLPIVKKLIELMGGTIQIKSKKGVGTEVVLELTTELVDPERPEEPVAEDALDDGLLRGKRLLLCEDHPLNREIASRLLAKKGIAVDSAENGQRGLEMFQAAELFHYAAVLMDIRMPVMDGLQTAAAIRALNRADAKAIPIIAMTANAFEDDIKKSMSAGMNAHLSKPIEPARLYQILGRLLQGRESEDNE